MRNILSGVGVFEESSSSEVRRIYEELARERAWHATPLAAEFAALAAQAFELAHAAEAWAMRTTESWIATDATGASIETVRALARQVAAIASIVNAELN